MTTSSDSKANLVKRIKLALIPLLILVLAAVLLWPAKEAASVVQPHAVRQSPLPEISKPSGDLKRSHSTWPTMTIEEITAHNPFDPLPVPEAPQPENSAAPPSERLASGDEAAPKRSSIGNLQAIYQDDRGAAAIFESQIVRVGDILAGVGRVTEITPQGLVVETVE